MRLGSRTSGAKTQPTFAMVGRLKRAASYGAHGRGPSTASSTPDACRPPPRGAGAGHDPRRVLADDFARQLILKASGLARDLAQYLRYYNTDRARTGRWTRGRTPGAVLGKAKMW